MSRICDVCKEPIPVGTSNIIKLQFGGKFAERVKKIHGVSYFDFCSLACFGKFVPLERTHP